MNSRDIASVHSSFPCGSRGSVPPFLPSLSTKTLFGCHNSDPTWLSVHVTDLCGPLFWAAAHCLDCVPCHRCSWSQEAPSFSGYTVGWCLSRLPVISLRIVQGMRVIKVSPFLSTLVIFLTTCMTCHELDWGLFLRDSHTSVITIPPLILAIPCYGKGLHILLNEQSIMLSCMIRRILCS